MTPHTVHPVALQDDPASATPLGRYRNGQLFTVRLTSSDEFDVPSLSAQDVRDAVQAKALEEDVPVGSVSVQAWVRVQA